MTSYITKCFESCLKWLSYFKFFQRYQHDEEDLGTISEEEDPTLVSL
jgi:hypothetical protein